MSAPESEEHETRVVVDAGDERLVLMAKEMFALGGDDFAKDVRALVDEWEKSLKSAYRVEPVTSPAKGLSAVAVIPTAPPDRSRSDDAVFVEGVFVASTDRTIQSVDVYANPAAAKDLAGCSATRPPGPPLGRRRERGSCNSKPENGDSSPGRTRAGSP